MEKTKRTTKTKAGKQFDGSTQRIAPHGTREGKTDTYTHTYTHTH